MNKTHDINNLYNLEYLPSININTYPFFREFEMKDNIRDHAHNYTKSYQIKKTWQFQPEQSSNLKENVTTLNVPMLFAKNSNAGEYLDMMLEWMGTKTFINRTAEELLFEGKFLSLHMVFIILFLNNHL